MPNSQAKHVVLPVALTKRPAAHEMHDDEPVESLAVPAAQGVHALAREDEYSPMPQLVHEAEPAPLHVPPGQSEHDALARSLKVPAGQVEGAAMPVADV